jgi:hypothetical protein
MRPFTELPVTGNVKTLMSVYARKESPSIFSPVARELLVGSQVVVQGAVVGDAVEGNAHWYRIDEDTYIWAGACTHLDPYPAFPENTRTNWMAVVFDVR